MPVFQIDVQKDLGGEFWANVYYVSCASLSQAESTFSTFLAFEQSFHYSQVHFNKLRASTLTENDFQFVSSAVDENGTLEATVAINPLFDAIRTDLNVAVGRPGRKYYRGCLQQTDWGELGFIDPAQRTLITTAVSDLITDLATLGDFTLVQRDGDEIITAAVAPFYTNRQLRRGSRRAVPVIE
jgi:hypothetical protein